MNKLKIYREYIILAAIAALLLLYIIFRSAGNINYTLPEPDIFDEDKISRLTFQGSAVDLDFSRTDDQWLIEPEGWPAENSNLTAITKALADLKITDLISTSGNPEVYDLGEEQRILVKAYDRDKVIRELFVGKVSSTGIYTYIMLPGDDNVYSVRGNLPSRISDRKSMRDKRFLQIDRDSVTEMVLSDGTAQKIVLYKDETTMWKSDSFDADDTAVKNVVNTLDPLRCKSYLYETPAGSPQWTVDFATGDGNVRLEIWPEASDNIYPARCSQNGYFVNMTAYATEKLLGAFGIVFDEE